MIDEKKISSFYPTEFEIIEFSKGNSKGIVKLIQDDHTISTNRIFAEGINSEISIFPENIKISIFYEGFNFVYHAEINETNRDTKKRTKELTRGALTFIDMLNNNSMKRITIVATDKTGLCQRTIKYLEDKIDSEKVLEEIKKINHKREYNHAEKLIETTQHYDLTYAFFGNHHFKSRIIQEQLKKNNVTYAIFKAKPDIINLEDFQYSQTNL